MEDGKTESMNSTQTIIEELATRQFFLTVAAGKRLIGKATAALPEVAHALVEGTLVVLAGSTNGYVAEEILKLAGLEKGFSRKGFLRGVTTAPGHKLNQGAAGESFVGDLIFVRGERVLGKTIFDMAPTLKAGDVVIKGANAVNLESDQAAILIGHPEMGTIGAALQAVIGRRTILVLPVGLEKRVSGDLHEIAKCMNDPSTTGLRYLPVDGLIITELEAVEWLTGAETMLIAAGGVCGAEGGVWLAVTGTAEELEAAEALLREVSGEPAFEA